MLSFVTDNAVLILAAMVAANTLGAAIARFTKTEKDDAVFSFVGGLLSKLGTFGLAKTASKTKADA